MIGTDWELGNIDDDGVYRNGEIANKELEKLDILKNTENAFFNQPDVRIHLISGEREPEYAPIYNAEGKIGPGANERVDDPEFSLLLAKAHAEGRQLSAKEIQELKQKAATMPDKVQNPKKKEK